MSLVSSFGAMCQMIAANLGIGLLPLAAFEAQHSLRGLSAVRLTEYQITPPSDHADVLMKRVSSSGSRSVNSSDRRQPRSGRRSLGGGRPRKGDPTLALRLSLSCVLPETVPGQALSSD